MLLYLLPTGYWISRLLTEAGSITATLATLCAVTVVLRNDWSQRARLTAVALAAIGLVATILMRPSSGVLLAAAVGGASMLMIATELMRHRRVDRAVTSLAGVCVTVVALWQVLANMLDLPGMRETVQDMFTRHFTQPDVPDPWLRLWEANKEYWPAQIEGWLNGGVPLAAASVLAFLVATVYVVPRALPARDALVWLAVGTTGLVTVAVHPVWSEVDRLMIVTWLPLVVGLAMVARRRSTVEAPAEPPGVSRQPSTAGTS